MANHGVSAAALIEDMRTVLTAYWRLSSKRLTENVCMSFEAHVLQKLSEEIESELLTAVQLRPDVDDLFFEPPEVNGFIQSAQNRAIRRPPPGSIPRFCCHALDACTDGGSARKP